MSITLHALPPSHPCMTAEAAIKLKGLDFERVDLPMTGHNDEMEKLYGEGHKTVPGAMFDGEAVHGSRAILSRLDAIVADPPLYPSDAVREAERWGDEELQDLGRRLPWGALHFRPEAMGLMAPDGEPLDPPGTDYAIRFVRAGWKYHGISCERLAADLAGLPEKIDRIVGWLDDGTLGGETPNAADLQIGATVSVLLFVGDLHPTLAPVTDWARGLFPRQAGEVPAGAFPAGWI